MNRTPNLNLPIYNTPSTDLFKLEDWNGANNAIDGAYQTINNKFDTIMSLDGASTNVEIVEARKGETNLGTKIEKIDTQLEDIITIIPNGTDDTVEIQNVLDFGKVPRLIQGTYIVSSLTLNDGAKILTSGYKTKLKQKLGVASGTRILNIVGSDVILDELSCEGNISTDTGEQNHAIIIRSVEKIIKNITIKGLKSKNIRGDGLYIGGNTSYNPENINVGIVYSENCIRNGVSITGGKNINIDNIIALQCGVIGVDLESDTQGGAIKGVKIGNIITSNLGILASGTGYPYVEDIEIGNVTLRRSHMNSTPDYPNSLETDKDAVIFRNSRNVIIKNLDIDGFDRHAILFMIVGGERYNDKIKIENLKVTNCSLTDTIYNSYINVSGVITVEISNIDATTQTGKTFIKGSSKTAEEQNVIVRKANYNGGMFVYSCGIHGENIKATSDTTFMSSIKSLSKIINSKLNGTTFIGYSDNVIFDGNTLTYTTKETGGTNIFKNNIINGTFIP